MKVALDRPIEIQLPSVPNYVTIDIITKCYECSASSIDVSELSDKEVEIIIAKWSEKFRENVKSRRSIQKLTIR